MVAHGRNLASIAQLAELAHALRDRRAHGQHAQPLPVREREARVARAHLVPEIPHTGVAVLAGNTVQQHHRAVRQFRQPGLESFAHRLVAGRTVEMQQVDRAIVQSLPVAPHARTLVSTGHRAAARAKRQALDRMAEGGI